MSSYRKLSEREQRAGRAQSAAQHRALAEIARRAPWYPKMECTPVSVIIRRGPWL